MMTAFIVLVVVVTIFLAGMCACAYANDGPSDFGPMSIIFLAFGLLGLYSLIVGK